MPGKGAKVHGGVDGNEHIGVLRHRLVGRQRADESDLENARRRSRRLDEGEHGFEQVGSRVRHRGQGASGRLWRRRAMRLSVSFT
ncbi:MAG TPA: hypothetical protein VH913_16210, partial [Hyphomicrobiaceae bacterium]